ncbi:MAG: hypothetical protein M5U28_09965 [Sandaracinaceae bacterium]|nr:hypothetical protein [Sandaracinaceae bacterium]
MGAEGGTLELEDLELRVPAGAVAAGTVITVTVESAAPPAPFTGFSPVFRFEPAGLVFDEPVTVRLPFDGDPAVASVFWTTLGAAAYAPVATRTEGADRHRREHALQQRVRGHGLQRRLLRSRQRRPRRPAHGRQLQLDDRGAGLARGADPAHGPRARHGRSRR